MTDHITQNPTANVDLDALARKVRADLHTLRYPHHPWVVAHRHESGKHVYDVVIIGAGQGGLALAAGLLRDRFSAPAHEHDAQARPFALGIINDYPLCKR